MTSLYFVRHAQPRRDWSDDRTRPLADVALRDREKVRKALAGVRLDAAVSSLYTRSFDTILPCAAAHGLEIRTDERLRERKKGSGGNNAGMFQKRWADFAYHEDGGESLGEVQRRNVEAVGEQLAAHRGENVLIGTHGTALSTILNYFAADFLCDGFLRIIDFMPYIIRLDFDGERYLGREELLIIEKQFNSSGRADK